MAKIVSGAQRRPKRGLEDFMLAHEFFAGARQKEQAQQQQALENQMGLQKLMLAMQQQRAKSQALLNQQAQAGDVRALQEMALQARRSPIENRAEEGMKLLSGITEPKQRGEALKAYKQLLDEEDNFARFQSAGEMLQHASESPEIFPPEQIQDWATRLQSKRAAGESPDDVMSEIMTVRKKKGEAATNRGENEEALAQAQALVQSMPRGSFERRQAEVALNAVMADESSLGRQGMGTKVLQAVQKAALGPRTGFEERQQAQADARVMPGLGGMKSGEMKKQLEREPFMGFGGPKIPEYTGGTRATRKSGVGPGPKKKAWVVADTSALDQATESIYSQTQDPIEIAKALQAQGFKLNAETQKAVRAFLSRKAASGQTASR